MNWKNGGHGVYEEWANRWEGEDADGYLIWWGNWSENDVIFYKKEMKEK